eukprot:CAMPEP_0170346974 /NCGR_PEP_ID=MMETSP0116_2-20130129/74737_1 /TAXON_ID=400756 /ORGANISM="Durinskia baltica, Strain CSIRO CS-38" /LENGTH=69 /DNA_ID=CAMNT_0010600777 /DNA_START=195 /DNA_END=404 /DNA_ORIENTATION=-
MGRGADVSLAPRPGKTEGAQQSSSRRPFVGAPGRPPEPTSWMDVGGAHHSTVAPACQKEGGNRQPKERL